MRATIGFCGLIWAIGMLAACGGPQPSSPNMSDAGSSSNEQTSEAATTHSAATTEDSTTSGSESSTQEVSSASSAPETSSHSGATTNTDVTTGQVAPAPIELDRERNIFPLENRPIPPNALHSHIEVVLERTGTLTVKAAFVSQADNGFLSNACEIAEVTNECVFASCSTGEASALPKLYQDVGELTVKVERLGLDYLLTETLEFGYSAITLDQLDTGDELVFNATGGDYPAFEVRATVPSFLELSDISFEGGRAAHQWPEALTLNWSGGLDAMYLQVEQDPALRCFYDSTTGSATIAQAAMEKTSQAEVLIPYVVAREVATTAGGDVVVTVRRSIYDRPLAGQAFPVEFYFE